MAQTEERTARRLTGSPRAKGGSGSSRAAPGDGRAEAVHSRGGSEVEGEWETGAETRDAPATAAPPPSPPRKRVPASPHPAPQRRRPPVATPLIGLRLGSRAPSSGGLPETPPPAPNPRARVRPSRRLPRASTGARSLCFPLRRPAFPLAGSAGLGTSPPTAAWLGHLPLPAGKTLEPDSGE